jgi:hypothetical protein
VVEREEQIMSAHGVPLEEIRRLGLEALARQLGPVGMVRFLQQFETGQGDYTAERHQWLSGGRVRDLAHQIREESRS